MGPSRLTRKQSQARTRARLLDSAARTVARDGLDAASLERITDGAGYTRGAFYANFGGRSELYLALLERAFDQYIERFERTLGSDESPEVRARRAGDELAEMVAADPEWQRLFFELAVYALRDGDFRRELTSRLRGLRERVAGVFSTRAAAYGVEPPLAVERLTLMTFAIWAGVSLGQLLEPDAFDEGVHGELLSIFFGGLATAKPTP